MNTKAVGDFGENIASKFITDKGYSIISRNYRVKSGEVDIIAMDSKTLVFIEVKTRKNSEFAFAREAVDYKKQYRIKNVAKSYIADNFIIYDSIRFDIIEIYTDKKYIQHFENAF